jgi:Tol biopolymer transport system component/C-terminal processing protease CtpA/Prc
MKKILLSFALLATGLLFCQNPLWMRYTSISPDGSEIAFNYRGDIYLVPSSGGVARAITTHESHDFMPVWSKDGSQIAFASNRFGNYDVFVMPSKGGIAKRLTFHSNNDYPHSFTNSNKILFTSARTDSHLNTQFPSGRLPELYSVDLANNLTQVLTTPAEDAQWNANETNLVYHDKKGYEDMWRKHHTSSIARDIWLYDAGSKTHEKLTDFHGEDRTPIWNSNENTIFYLSEESGSFNVYELNVKSKTKTQLTDFKKHPIRFLSSSDANTLCFGYNGEIYTMIAGGKPRKVGVEIYSDLDFNSVEKMNVNGNVSEVTYSPNGKEIAFIARGEVFVSSVDYKQTKQITDTPEQERGVSFSPDGSSLLFASERDNSWNLYQVKLERETEKYFYNATNLKEETILQTKAETFQPSYSPDGKEVAFLEDRVVLRVLNLKSKQTRTVLEKSFNYSYSDGDQSYSWSPDSKWILVSYLPYNRWNTDIGLVSADGKQRINLTESGYNCSSPKWIMGGEAIIWFSGRNGMRSHGSWGNEVDCYAMFLTQGSYDQFSLNEIDYNLTKEIDKEKEKKGDSSKNKKKSKSKTASKSDEGEIKVKLLQFDFENLRERTKRLTINSSFISDVLVTKDGEKMYYLSYIEKGFDLWMTDFKKSETKLLSKLGTKAAGLVFDKDEKNIIVLSSGNIKKVDTSSGKAKSITYHAVMNWNKQKEYDYIFNHAWRQTRDKFYVEDMHNVDWGFYYSEYNRFLPHISNNEDFGEMLSEMLGELNASHTGARANTTIPNGDQTASLAIYPDYQFEGKGVKISEIMIKSPLHSKDKIISGSIITKINKTVINTLSDYYKALNNAKDKNTLIGFNTPDGKYREQVVKPISQRDLYGLQYKRFVDRTSKLVDELSGGKIGYVHVQGMNDASFRSVYSDALGKHADKESLLIDTRFNGGGWLHDDLATFLSGKLYATFVPRGQKIGNEPLERWYKPSAVIIGEGNYSDAHGFPFAYRALGIGKTIGMPIPGTMTAVWWERQINPSIVFGIPQVGVMGTDNQLQENNQFEPDIKVRNDYQSVSDGQDKQIEAAVKSLMQ